MAKEDKKIQFVASFDPSRQCVGMDGEGTAKITLQTSSDQLAKVIEAYASLTGRAFKVTLEPFTEALPGGRKGGPRSSETVR